MGPEVEFAGGHLHVGLAGRRDGNRLPIRITELRIRAGFVAPAVESILAIAAAFCFKVSSQANRRSPEPCKRSALSKRTWSDRRRPTGLSVYWPYSY